MVELLSKEKEEEDKPGILTSDAFSASVDSVKKAIKKSVRYNKGEALTSYRLMYDAPSSSIEPIYFWILDFIQDMGIDVRKITDNFTSSPGSGHFAEIGARATRMQEEGMKILGMINQVVKTVLNLIYDLKEFEIRLEHYQDAKAKDKEKKEGGILALKQIWLDQVDLKRGRGSIHQMSYEMGFTTLRELFMIANTIDDIKKTQVANDQVVRILIPRLNEFLKWQEYSEKELQKRYDIEKAYLKTEVESLKLYTSWVRPYLKAAEELRQQGFERNPALVNAFNTTMFDLVLFGKSKFNFDKTVMSKDLPRGFENYKLKRNYYSCYVVSLLFRGFPQKVTQQHYGFGGRVDMTFQCYSLNEDELRLIEKELERQDVETSLKFIQEGTDQSLEELKEDIEHFLGDYGKKEKKEVKKGDMNPFSALFSFFKKKEEKTKEGKKKISKIDDINKDNFVEREVRRLVGNSSMKSLYAIYDIYKKAHGMASSPENFSIPVQDKPVPIGFTDLFKKQMS